MNEMMSEKTYEEILHVLKGNMTFYSSKIKELKNEIRELKRSTGTLSSSEIEQEISILKNQIARYEKDRKLGLKQLKGITSAFAEYMNIVKERKAIFESGDNVLLAVVDEIEVKKLYKSELNKLYTAQKKLEVKIEKLIQKKDMKHVLLPYDNQGYIVAHNLNTDFSKEFFDMYKEKSNKIVEDREYEKLSPEIETFKNSRKVALEFVTECILGTKSSDLFKENNILVNIQKIRDSKLQVDSNSDINFSKAMSLLENYVAVEVKLVCIDQFINRIDKTHRGVQFKKTVKALNKEKIKIQKEKDKIFAEMQGYYKAGNGVEVLEAAEKKLKIENVQREIKDQNMAKHVFEDELADKNKSLDETITSPEIPAEEYYSGVNDTYTVVKEATPEQTSYVLQGDERKKVVKEANQSKKNIETAEEYVDRKRNELSELKNAPTLYELYIVARTKGYDKEFDSFKKFINKNNDELQAYKNEYEQSYEENFYGRKM